LKPGFLAFFEFFPKAAIKSLPGLVFIVENSKQPDRSVLN
jgi:hypothetical protein